MNPDRPIQSKDADRLNRYPFAVALASELGRIPAGPGRVAALVGPWGAGKTSVLELVRDELRSVEGAPILVDVNPWMFSGSDQVVELFIHALAEKLGSRDDKRAADAAEKLTEYATALDSLNWLPVADRLAKGMKGAAFWFRRKAPMFAGSIEKRRKAIGDALTAAGERLIVIVDDIDRLTDPEIREVVRAVRLVGDFENVAYLLAFDRRRVEKALEAGSEPGSGRDYLEKIVQSIHPLPEARYADLSTILGEELFAAVRDAQTGPFEAYDWQNIVSLAVRPLVGTVRDVYRFTNVLPATLAGVKDEVALQDVLALEAYRVLEPDVWDALVRAGPALGYIREGSYGGPDPERDRMGELVNGVVKSAGEGREEIVRQLLHRVFPATDRFLQNMNWSADSLAGWRKERRVAHPDIFAVYLERALPPGVLPAAYLDAVFASLGHAEQLQPLLDRLDEGQLEECLARLEAWEHEFPAPDAGTIAVLLSIGPKLREGRRRGMFDFGADLALDRIVLRLMRRSEDEAARLRVVEGALELDVGLAGAVALLRLVGHEENKGHELIPAEDADRLTQGVAARIAEAPPDLLAKERNLNVLIGWAHKMGGDTLLPRLTAALADDRVLAKLVRDSMWEGSGQTLGDVAARHYTRLPWDWLEKLLPEGELERRINGLRPRLAEGLDDRGREALALAERYAGGWRPRDLPDGDNDWRGLHGMT